MIKLYLKLFCLEIDLNVKYCKNADKGCKHEDKTPINAEECLEEIENLSDVEEVIEDNEESAIFSQAKLFEEELKRSGALFEVPYSDIPKRANIQDDVEIITDTFEKEVEDIIEGRR